MRLHPLFKWFGSKWQSAKHYPSPRHSRVIEPFAGGAGYSLNHSDKQVQIWDDDPNLQRLWSWLIHEATQASILDIPIHVPVSTDIRTLGLDEGQCLLLKHWQRTNSVGDCWTISPWGDLPGQWTENTRARVADEIGGIKHWTFARPTWSQQDPATWFVDPPYLYNYRYRADLPDFDFAGLVSGINTVHQDSLLIVCEATRKGDGAIPDYLPFSPSHRSVTSRRKPTQSHHSAELIWVRNPTMTPVSQL